jgi:hypothetical protein
MMNVHQQTTIEMNMEKMEEGNEREGEREREKTTQTANEDSEGDEEVSERREGKGTMKQEWANKGRRRRRNYREEQRGWRA